MSSFYDKGLIINKLYWLMNTTDTSDMNVVFRELTVYSLKPVQTFWKTKTASEQLAGC